MNINDFRKAAIAQQFLQYIGQLGSDIVGTAIGNRAGHSTAINDAGDVIAFGAPFWTSGYGQAKVYAWNGSSWAQRGSSFAGTVGDAFGQDVTLSADGTVVAISSSNYSYVKIYKWNGTTWTQRGSTITAADSAFGYSISLNGIGDTIAVGAWQSNVNGTNSGKVRVYGWDGSSWTQLADSIDGAVAGDQTGWKVALNSAGNRVLVVSKGYSSSKGLARVYQYVPAWYLQPAEWIQLGDDVIGGTNSGQLGFSASINDAGDKIAVSSNYTLAKVKMYSLVGSVWTQLGSDISGTPGNYFGQSISLNSSGNKVAISDIYASSGFGEVKIYSYNGSSWSQSGSTIAGKVSGDTNGYSVSLNSIGDRVLIGAPAYNSSPVTEGCVRVYQI